MQHRILMLMADTEALQALVAASTVYSEAFEARKSCIEQSVAENQLLSSVYLSSKALFRLQDFVIEKMLRSVNITVWVFELIHSPQDGQSTEQFSLRHFIEMHFPFLVSNDTDEECSPRPIHVSKEEKESVWLICDRIVRLARRLSLDLRNSPETLAAKEDDTTRTLRASNCIILLELFCVLFTAPATLEQHITRGPNCPIGWIQHRWAETLYWNLDDQSLHDLRYVGCWAKAKIDAFVSSNVDSKHGPGYAVSPGPGEPAIQHNFHDLARLWDNSYSTQRHITCLDARVLDETLSAANVNDPAAYSALCRHLNGCARRRAVWALVEDGWRMCTEGIVPPQLAHMYQYRPRRF